MDLCADLFPDDAEEKKECSLKILIPASAIGSIMGRSGEAVHKLEVSTGTKITISGLKDCYPGTKDRVCLISGNMDSVSRVNRIIMDKMFSNPDICYRGNYNTQKDRSFRPRQVKLIIPQSTASKVIGKAGSTIEKMKGGSGSFIQLSRKAFPVMLRERCVTVNGDPLGNDKACRMILKIIADETNADYYKNVSYSEANFPLPNAVMSGPPIAKAKYNIKLETLPNSISRRDLTVFLELLRSSLVGMGFPEETVNQTAECILTLSNHRVMDICLSFMINWFYPRAYSVYERNKGIVPLEKALPNAPPVQETPPSNVPFISMFTSLDPSLQSYLGPVSAPKQSRFGHRFALAASASSASSDIAAAESDLGIKKSVSASASAGFQSRPNDVSEEIGFDFWRSAYALPSFQSKPKDSNHGSALSGCPSTGFPRLENFTPGNATAIAGFNSGRSSEAIGANHLASRYILYQRALGDNTVQKR